MIRASLEDVLSMLELGVEQRTKSEEVLSKSLGLEADQELKRRTDKEAEEKVYGALQGIETCLYETHYHAFALLALRCLLGEDAFDKVLNIVCSKNAVKKYVAEESGRSCHRVNGEQSTYVCFVDACALYCSCRSFGMLTLVFLYALG